MKTGFDSHIEAAVQKSFEDSAYKAIASRLRTEKRIVSKLVTAALKANLLISVSDGEEFVVKKSSNKAEIMAAFGSTDEDVIVLRHGSASKAFIGSTAEPGARAGMFQLVYGNDGDDVIADHSDNPICNALYAHVMGRQ